MMLRTEYHMSGTDALQILRDAAHNLCPSHMADVR
jgi:hypothetical protein